MATRSSRIHLSARFLTAAGVLFAIGVIASWLPFVGTIVSFIVFPLGAIAFAIALFALAAAISHRIARPALYIAAAGWVVVGLASFVPFPVPLSLLGAIAAGAGGLVAAIVSLQNHLLPQRSSVGFLVATIAGALYQLGFVSFTSFAMGVALIVTGVLLSRDE